MIFYKTLSYLLNMTVGSGIPANIYLFKVTIGKPEKRVKYVQS